MADGREVREDVEMREVRISAASGGYIITDDCGVYVRTELKSALEQLVYSMEGRCKLMSGPFYVKIDVEDWDEKTLSK